MIRVSLLAAFALSLFTANANSEQLDPYHQLRLYGNRVVGGSWHLQTENGPAQVHTYCWAVGHKFLLRHEWTEGGPNSLTIVGVDPVSQRQTGWSFSDQGEVFVVSYDVDRVNETEDSLKNFRSNAGDVLDSNGAAKVVWHNEDELTVEPAENDKLLNGKPAEKETWKRSKEEADTSWIEADPPAEIPGSCSIAAHLVGKRFIEGVLPTKKTFHGNTVVKWILAGKCLILTGATINEDQAAFGTVVIFVANPEGQQGRWWQFQSDGSVNEISVTPDGTTVDGTSTTGNGDKISFHGVFSLDGEKVRYKSKLSVNGGDPLPYGWSYRKID
ncbi:hypothetical protein [Novipirellula artificiosorum]|uniref:Lipocalin-like domain-containing protein n=1 Tax=Novipirellula artificiosorum TaxID=2528016 RepID=A0A5C6DUD1_9BACT|nr:hypothetical protein [Novipirellula artificiosorum]TWU39517.1 hypothetical protein Poly41_23720 [Novipirellula artificiosorum]